MHPELRRVPLNEGILAVEIRGQGPPLLLLHGISANRHLWAPVAEDLEKRYRLYMPDLLGRGDSDPCERTGFHLGDEVDRLERLLARIELRPSLIAGHSQGAALALALASRLPAVRGLVLVNPVHPEVQRPGALDLLAHGPVRRAVAGALRPIRRPLARRITAASYGSRRPPPEPIVRQYAAPYGDPARARTLLKVLADWNPAEITHFLPRRRLRGVVLAGARDRRIGATGPRILARRLGLPCRVVEGAGHVLPEERPGLVIEAILHTARQLSRRAAPREGNHA